MRLFDAHCHLQLPQFDADRDAVLRRMQEGDAGAIVIGTDFETSKAAVELARQHDFLWATVGLHPNDNDSEVFDAEKYEALARDPKVVAIGECGLDYFRSSGEGQKEKFEAQIALAQRTGKALIIHCRDAHEDMLETLGRLKLPVPVVIHFFTGSGELAQKYLDLGCYLSFPGPITYTDMYDDSIRLCPLERLLVETDAPFAAPVPHRGKRNEPVYAMRVAEKVAQIKNISPERVMQAAVQNARSAGLMGR